MNHVATYTARQGNPAQIGKAERTAPKAPRLCRVDATPERRLGNPKGQKAVPSRSNATDAFLRTRFLPKLETGETLQANRKTSKVERDFYKSLSLLSRHYGIEPMEAQHLGYPYNIALSVWDAKIQLSGKVSCFEELKIVAEGKKHFIECTERLNIGSTLFYIPVLPLYGILRNSKGRRAGLLLLSLCSYLYRVVDIPYYRDEYSHLSWHYEMMADWVGTDDQTDATETYSRELEIAEWVGDFIGQKLGNINNLEYFGKRIASFRCSSLLDRECLKMAREAYTLYLQYPDTNCYRNAKPNGTYDVEDEYDVASMDKFVSFCAHHRGWLNDSLIDSINAELGEYGDMEEPAITKRFDGKAVDGTSLDFENRLFTLIDDLVYLLNNYARML